MVFALLAFVPRRRRAIGRAWALGGSRHRLALRYAPELDRRLRKRLKATNDSWRVDETYVRVKGKWVYLYRAVDSTGATIDFLLSAKRDAAAAERFLTKALGGENHPAPRVINTDKHATYPPAIVELKADGVLEEKCTHRAVQYLNILELRQSHVRRPVSRGQLPRRRAPPADARCHCARPRNRRRS
jgi:IS6 family transposase